MHRVWYGGSTEDQGRNSEVWVGFILMCICLSSLIVGGFLPPLKLHSSREFHPFPVACNLDSRTDILLEGVGAILRIVG